MLERHVDVRKRLRLDALRRIDDEQRALAGRQAARNLIRKVDMARRVDEVELVLLAVLALVVQTHRLRLDGDAALALDVHVVEDLRLHLALRKCPRIFNQTVRNRRFSMVNMGNDGKVADVLVLHVHFPFNIHVVLIENIIPFPRLLLQEKQRNGCFFTWPMILYLGNDIN